jgi:hypothetical protein
MCATREFSGGYGQFVAARPKFETLPGKVDPAKKVRSRPAIRVDDGHAGMPRARARAGDLYFT